MTDVHDRRPGWRAAVRDRSFLVHYLRMLAAMAVGMVVLGPLSMLPAMLVVMLRRPADYTGPHAQRRPLRST